MFNVNIRSRHGSHDAIRKTTKLPFRSVVRFGSSTTLEEVYKKNLKKVNFNNVVECNTVEAVKKSASKRLMKKAFAEFDVKTAEWFEKHPTLDHSFIGKGGVTVHNTDLPYPIVAKHIHGSRGEGNFKLNNPQELTDWLVGKTPSNYIFEKFYNFAREYRLHVTADRCFYTCRKMLKQGTPDDKKWFRNDSNSVWILEENPLFDKPVNWGKVVEESIKALKAVGLDIGAIDVKIQSAKNENGNTRPDPEFIILETNSAPSFGEITLEKYKVEIPKILRKKHENK